MAILTQNAKMAKTSEHFKKNVLNFNIPAHKTAAGKITCPFADTCLKYCYAQKGNYKRFARSIDPHLEANYALTQLDTFVSVIDADLKGRRKIGIGKRCKVDYLRIHDSGDFYSPKYLQKWFEIARLNPETRFYAYTNSIKFFKDDLFENITMPDNFSIIFSDSGKDKDKITKYDRQTGIFSALDELLAANYIDASQFDLYATKWYNKSGKVGLIYH